MSIGGGPPVGPPKVNVAICDLNRIVPSDGLRRYGLSILKHKGNERPKCL